VDGWVVTSLTSMIHPVDVSHAAQPSAGLCSARGMKEESMRQRPMRTLLWTMFLVMAVGMVACSGVRRGPSAGPSQRMHADAALEERLPGGVRLAAASGVATADAPTPILPLDDEEVLEEYDPWGPFNRPCDRVAAI
jgi:hypothetical protein